MATHACSVQYTEEQKPRQQRLLQMAEHAHSVRAAEKDEQRQQHARSVRAVEDEQQRQQRLQQMATLSARRRLHICTT